MHKTDTVLTPDGTVHVYDPGLVKATCPLPVYNASTFIIVGLVVMARGVVVVGLVVMARGVVVGGTEVVGLGVVVMGRDDVDGGVVVEGGNVANLALIFLSMSSVRH